MTDEDIDYSLNGPLAPLHERNAYPEWQMMISPPPGWFDLVLELNEHLAALIPDYTIGQIKEKFASLRYYIGDYGVPSDDDRIDEAEALIRTYEARSRTICQDCGQPGSERTNNRWWATLCDTHDDLTPGDG